MLSKIKVPMPLKNIYCIKRGKNNICYVYYILKTYRNNKGQPTNDAILIGKKDEETALLIPNDNYFDRFNCTIKVFNKEGKCI